MHIHEILHTVTVWFSQHYIQDGQLNVSHLLKDLFMVLIALPLPALFLATPFMYVTSKIRSIIGSLILGKE
jgi:hypothetical protein